MNNRCLLRKGLLGKDEREKEYDKGPNRKAEGSVERKKRRRGTIQQRRT